MLPLEEAQQLVLSTVSPLERIWVPISESLGYILAEDIYSTLNVPPWDNAAMDGYAVRAIDTQGASRSNPKVFKVIGEVSAGSLSDVTIRPGTAVRIMTGAPLPRGADAVVQFEDTDEEDRKARGEALTEIAVFKQAEPGLNVRPAGEDIKSGSLVLKQGTEIRPAEMGVLAALGLSRVPVIRRPVVAILATGNELADVGVPLKPAQIYNSNTYSLIGQVLRAGGIPKPLGIARDMAEELREKISQAFDADLFLTSGGVSKGDYDLVKEVLAAEGEVSFWTVKIKPGKPLAFGVFHKGEKKVPHLGLPGNPVSSMVTFELFARPAILKMRGKKHLEKPRIRATLEDRITKKDDRRHFLRVRVRCEAGRYLARLTGPQGSGILTSMALSNGLAIIPEEVKELPPGSEVDVLMLDWNEEAG